MSRLFTVLITTLAIGGCTLVELEGDSGVGVVPGPRNEPKSVEQIETVLFGDGAKTWEAQSFTLIGIEGFQQCRLDDSIILTEDGSYQYDGGLILCGAEDNRKVKSGLWEINDQLQLLFHENEEITHIGEIIGITQDSLVLRGSYLGLEVKGLYVSN